jgi:hypothetical protein
MNKLVASAADTAESPQTKRIDTMKTLPNSPLPPVSLDDVIIRMHQL